MTELFTSPKPIKDLSDTGYQSGIKDHCLKIAISGAKNIRFLSHIMKVTLLVVMCTLVVLLQGMEIEACESASYVFCARAML